MSDTPTETQNQTEVVEISTSLEPSVSDLISQDDFDRLYEAELKASRGDTKERDKVTKEIEAAFKPTPAPLGRPKEEGAAGVAGQEEIAVQSDTGASGGGSEGDVTPAKTEQEQATDDWLNSITDPAIKANVEKLLQEQQKFEQYRKSNEGRLAAEQRNARLAREEVQRLQRQQQVQPKQETPAKPADVVKKQQEDAELLKMLEEADPAMAKIIQRRLDEAQEIQKRLDALDSRFEQATQTQQQRQVETELQRLEAQVPNYQEIWDSDAYRHFIEEVAPPPIIRAHNSPTAESAAQAIFAYGKWIEAQMNQQSGATKTDAVTNPAASAQAQKIQEDRARRASTTPVAPSGTSRPSALPADPLADILADPKKAEKMFEEQYNAHLKKVYGR